MTNWNTLHMDTHSQLHMNMTMIMSKGTSTRSASLCRSWGTYTCPSFIPPLTKCLGFWNYPKVIDKSVRSTPTPTARSFKQCREFNQAPFRFLASMSPEGILINYEILFDLMWREGVLIIHMLYSHALHTHGISGRNCATRKNSKWNSATIREMLDVSIHVTSKHDCWIQNLDLQLGHLGIQLPRMAFNFIFLAHNRIII